MSEEREIRPLKIPRKVRKITTYRNVIDHVIHLKLEGMINDKAANTIVRACKTGVEVFIAEQYMKQMGLDVMPDDVLPRLSSGEARKLMHQQRLDAIEQRAIDAEVVEEIRSNEPDELSDEDEAMLKEMLK